MCTIYATLWALWTHKPTIKLARTLRKLLSSMCINTNATQNWVGHGNLHCGGSMQPISGGGNGVCETNVQRFAMHQAAGIATNGGMLQMHGVGVEEPFSFTSYN
jgi:hypothetical protein